MQDGFGPTKLDESRTFLATWIRRRTFQTVALPGYRLHPLRGEKRGWWSVTISGNWRIVFRFRDGDAFDVDLVDYH